MTPCEISIQVYELSLFSFKDSILDLIYVTLKLRSFKKKKKLNSFFPHNVCCMHYNMNTSKHYLRFTTTFWQSWIVLNSQATLQNRKTNNKATQRMLCKAVSLAWHLICFKFSSKVWNKSLDTSKTLGRKIDANVPFTLRFCP